MKKLIILISTIILLLSACSSKYQKAIKKIDNRKIEAYNEDAILQDEENSVH
jgi:protein involved in sex pheromone biosynthesis